MELIDRKSALDLGLKQYFTGKECSRGHIFPRRVACGACMECKRLVTKRWREDGGLADFNPSGKPLPSQDYLRECFDYKIDTGELIWLKRPLQHFDTVVGMKVQNKRAGGVAGHYHSRNGYLEVRFDGALYKGHRLIYKLLTGEEPDGMLDHIDGDVSNNRVENLRVSTAQQNARNAKTRNKAGSGYKGVWPGRKDEWVTSLTISDKAQEAFSFSTELEAARKYDELAKEYYGEFAKLNFPEGSND